MREFSFLSLYTFWENCVVFFQFLNDKMQNYVLFDIIVDFIIQKLQNKHSFLKKYKKLRKLNSLILTGQEETKTKYFARKSVTIDPTDLILNF